MKKLWAVLMAFVFLPLVISLSNTAYATSKVYKIAIIQYDKGAVYDLPKEAFKAELARLGVKAKYVEYNCNRRLGAFADSLIEDIIKQKPDLILSLGTGITEYLAGVRAGKPIEVPVKITNIPIVFAAVTNPVVSGIVKNWKSSGNNFTGASIFFSPDRLFATLRRAGPYRKVLVPLDKNLLGCTLVSLRTIEKIKDRMGFQFVLVYGNKAQDIDKAAADKDFDAIAVLFDNVAIEALTSGVLERYQNLKRAPIISVLTFLKDKCVFSYGEDFSHNGQVAAKKAYSILVEGKSPSEIPIYRVKKPYFVINMRLAKQLGVKLPPSLLAMADEVIK